MDAKKCLITQERLTPETDSFAHIIPLALGGTLKPKGLINRTANDILNKRVDLRIIKLFNPIMASLGGLREDGSSPPNTIMTDTNGDKYYTNFATPFRATKPAFEKTETPEGILYNFHSRDSQDYENHLKRIQKLHPDIDLDIPSALANATIVESYPEHPMGYDLNMSENNIFPAIFVMASLFAEHHKVGAHPLLREYVTNLSDFHTKELIDNIPLPPDTFYWIPEFEVIANEPDTHTIFLLACPLKRKALISIELFGIYCGTINVPYEGDEIINEVYGINILTGEEVTPDINWDYVLKSDWRATHKTDDPFIMIRNAKRLERLITLIERRSLEKELSRLVDRNLADTADRENTLENAELLLDGILGDFQNLFDSIADRYTQREHHKTKVDERPTASSLNKQQKET
ncbi:hypothetical protein [Pseudomonas sp. NPDC087817]|uniref:hypothetical protein n=1 Tax=Pseudomonas sp. NPDC087817 TaxID=3364451 RepID=UPI0037FFF9CC